MEFKTIITSVEDGVGIIKLNRPKAMNAINSELLEECCVALDQMQADPEVKTIMAYGGDQVFAAGADIKNFLTYSPMEAWEFIDLVHKTIFKIEDNYKPVVAAINGFALGGGCELAMACDLRVAAENATFGLPEINLGIYPGGGGTQRFARFAGIGRAKEMVLTGNFFDGKRAYEIGLVNVLVPPEEVFETAKKLCKRLGKKSAMALRLAKQAVNNSFNTDIKTGSKFEQDGFALLFSTDDQTECMSAFVEGRKATLTGK